MARETRNIHSHSLSGKVLCSEARPWIMEKEEAGDASMQMYKTWLFNNKKKKDRKDMIKYGMKWTPRMVVYQQNRDDVLKRIEVDYGGSQELQICSSITRRLSGRHNDNEALGDGDSFMKTKNWEDIKPMWQEYAQAQFGAEARDRQTTGEGTLKKTEETSL
ncbi:uncharacterized protein EDB91DRAFT_1081204 [Suillus paluster]|uniref:uncharacterized protein n=1 Tax=Suillus paluster TaxID=48578 RepID=UPI001B87FB62|nr:uncharacterized protein EDB91DRAFT_1081204 [Suillus paluster]KAG1743262.1 hypothetical protein EDB91DRAFT_1081204 [Suillus paluster]